MISPRGVEVSSTLSIMSSVLYIRSAAFCVIWRQSSAYIRHAAPSGWNCSVASLPFASGLSPPSGADGGGA